MSPETQDDPIPGPSCAQEPLPKKDNNVLHQTEELPQTFTAHPTTSLSPLLPLRNSTPLPSDAIQGKTFQATYTSAAESTSTQFPELSSSPSSRANPFEQIEQIPTNQTSTPIQSSGWYTVNPAFGKCLTELINERFKRLSSEQQIKAFSEILLHTERLTEELMKTAKNKDTRLTYLLHFITKN